MSCPNKSHPDWKLLVSQVGEKLAFTTWMAYGEIIPENLVKSTAQLQKEIKLPRMIAKDRIQAAYSLIRKYNAKNGTAHTIGQFSKPGDSPYYTRLTVKPNYLPVNIERQRLRDWERSEESISKVADIEEVYGPENFVQTSNESEQQQIKQGVEELFDSNPELANQVYEALGFKEKYEGAEKGDLINELKQITDTYLKEFADLFIQSNINIPLYYSKGNDYAYVVPDNTIIISKASFAIFSSLIILF